MGWAQTAPTLTSVTDLTGATEDTDFVIGYAMLKAAANEADVDLDTINFKIRSVTAGTMVLRNVGTSGANPPIGAILEDGKELVWTPPPQSNNTIAVFTIRANDGTIDSSTDVTVRIQVTAVNDAPTLSIINPLTGPSNSALGNEDSDIAIPFATVLGASDAVDIDSPITFRIQTVAPGTTLTLGGVAVVPGATVFSAGQTLTWRPAANVYGDTLSACTVVAWDGALASAAATVQVKVASVNDAPTLTTIGLLSDASNNEDSNIAIPFATLLAASNASDVADGGTVSFRIQSVASGTTLTLGGVPVVPGTTLFSTSQSLTWRPPLNVSGNLPACTVVAWDGALASATPVTVQVQVNAVDDAPAFPPGVLPGVTHELGQAPVALVGSITPSDLDGPPTNYSSLGLVAQLQTAFGVTPQADDELLVMPGPGLTMVTGGDGYILRSSNGPGLHDAATVASPVTGTTALSIRFLASTTEADLPVVAASVFYRNRLGSSAPTATSAKRQVAMRFTGGNDGPSTTVDVTLVRDNPPPQVVVQASLNVAPQAVSRVTDAVLRCTDLTGGIATATTGITYVVTLAPGFGTLRRAGAQVGPGGTFTQADIDAGVVDYLNTNPDATFDQVGLRVEDAATPPRSTSLILAVRILRSLSQYQIISDPPMVVRADTATALAVSVLFPDVTETRRLAFFIENSTAGTLAWTRSDTARPASNTLTITMPASAIGLQAFDIVYGEYTAGSTPLVPVQSGQVVARQRVRLLVVGAATPALRVGG